MRWLVITALLSAACLPSDEERCASARSYLQERLVTLRTQYVETRDRAAGLERDAKARHRLHGSYTARAQRANDCIEQIDRIDTAYASDDHAEVKRLVAELTDFDAIAAGHLRSQQRSVDRWCR